MINFRKLVALAASIAALAGSATAAPPPDTAADQVAVRAMIAAWFDAYNAADGAALAALYTEDAVLNAPGVPAVRGKAAIRQYYLKDRAKFAAAGLTYVDGPTNYVGVSGDLGWQSGTLKVINKSGATVEADGGKYLSVFQRKVGKWLFIRDNWDTLNSSAACTAKAPAAPPQ